MANSKFKSVEAYINSFPKDLQEILQEIRATIKKAVPEAEEKISYQMPAFKYHGMLIWYAAWNKHIGVYPKTPTIEVAFEKELSEYEKSKGTIKFPLDKPVPYQLIGKIARFRAKENLQKTTR